MDNVWSLVMPSNYIVAYHTEQEDEALAKVRTAAEKTEEIISCINARRSGEHDVQVGSFPLLKTFVAGHLFRRYALSAKPFRSTYDCNGCGKCAKDCPTENICVAEGMPFWFDTCEQCLACIHNCPKRAIEYGRSTEKHGRYSFRYTDEQIYAKPTEATDETV